MIVPFAAGGATDILTRYIGQEMNKTWKQPMLVENRSGASTQIASQMVATSKPDGYTLLMAANPHTVNPSLFQNLPYDTRSAFAPVSLVTTGPLLVVAHPSLEVTTVRELIELARKKPGLINYASSGTGGPQHMAGELFKYLNKVNMVHVPFKGGGEAIPQLLGGHVQVGFSNPISIIEHVRAGKLKSLAITSIKRSENMPQVPTMAEAANLPGFDVAVWFGFLVVAKTPEDIVTKLQTEIKRVIFTPKGKELMEKDGYEPIGSTPAEFADFIDREIVRWSELVKVAKIKAD